MRTKIASAIAIAIAMLAASSLAYAADNGGKNSGADAKDGINADGTADDAKKCREGTEGAALCGEDMNTQQ